MTGGLLLLAALATACPEPLFTRGDLAFRAGTFSPPTETPSPTACERAGGSLLVMKRGKQGVQAYVCGFESRFTGPELEAELSSAGPAAGAASSADAVARRRVPSCPLDGKRDARVEGAPGSRTLVVVCAASIPPRAWCVEPGAVPGPHGRGCLTSACPAGTEHVAFRGSAGACVTCPAGAVDLRETLSRNPEAFAKASGLPFASPASVNWICRAPADAPCRPTPSR